MTIQSTISNLFTAKKQSTPITEERPAPTRQGLGLLADIGWRVASKGESVRKASSIRPYLISVCFGLLAVGGLIIALLSQQIKDMKVEIARQKQQLSATEVRVSRLERASQQQNAKDPRTLATPPQHDAISLSMDDIKAVRSFIKVPPTKPRTQQKSRVGEEVSNFRSVPVPDSLVSQIPKLRGARFVVDNNGAILLFGEGVGIFRSPAKPFCVVPVL